MKTLADSLLQQEAQAPMEEECASDDDTPIEHCAAYAAAKPGYCLLCGKKLKSLPASTPRNKQNAFRDNIHSQCVAMLKKHSDYDAQTWMKTPKKVRATLCVLTMLQVWLEVQQQPITKRIKKAHAAAPEATMADAPQGEYESDTECDQILYDHVVKGFNKHRDSKVGQNLEIGSRIAVEWHNSDNTPYWANAIVTGKAPFLDGKYATCEWTVQYDVSHEIVDHLLWPPPKNGSSKHYNWKLLRPPQVDTGVPMQQQQHTAAAMPERMSLYVKSSTPQVTTKPNDTPLESPQSNAAPTPAATPLVLNVAHHVQVQALPSQGSMPPPPPVPLHALQARKPPQVSKGAQQFDKGSNDEWLKGPKNKNNPPPVPKETEQSSNPTTATKFHNIDLSNVITRYWGNHEQSEQISPEQKEENKRTTAETKKDIEKQNLADFCKKDGGQYASWLNLG